MLLDSIGSPGDLKKLDLSQLPELCAEIRSYIIDCCSRNPGHLASSLGAVELTVALHYVFDAPSDKLVFDVGHQAYAHKILTGRKEEFKTMRTSGGIAGFPKISESEYDAFGTGHSSTSISAALGMAEAARLKGSSSKAVAIIGDGSLTGGMAFEGLNNAGSSKANILVIVNDNNQSIDSNIGGLHDHLLKITTSRRYNNVKNRVWDLLGESKFRMRLQSAWRGLKSYLVKKTGGDIFEALGLRYFGPVDGNDVLSLVEALRKIRDLDGPRVLHCITVKGKGYAPAENDPTTWHAPGRFNPETGERIRSVHSADRYQDVFGATLCDLAREDSRVIGITPAMASGCGMTEFADTFPDRFYDVGIEEEHAVTFSAGLAASGMRPFCNIYSAFSQRAYDQIIHDIALQQLPVILCFDRAGLVGEDGSTHQGAFDMAAYRPIPNVTIAVPSDELELRNMMYSALQSTTGPYIIRYPRGMGNGTVWRDVPFQSIETGKARMMRDGEKVALIAVGPVAAQAAAAAEDLDKNIAVYDFRFIKPFDAGTLAQIARKFDTILTFEDGTIKGGLYSEVCERLSAAGYGGTVRGYGIPDEFISHASQAEQRKACHLDKESILEELERLKLF